MTRPEGWILFWTVMCTVCFGAFYLTALALVPLGLRDLLQLFRTLRRDDDNR